MALDRDETLKRADKLLKQGKIAGAIEEYARLVEDRPSDWNSANALGDLYIKAGDMGRAAEQFTHVADHLFGEGFLPRASAFYKKVLKVRSDDDHALWQLADIAGRHGLGVDARAFYGRLIKDRRAAGNERGALDCLVRLGMLDDADIEARTTAARTLVSIGESKQAARLMLGVADLHTKEGRLEDALDALDQAAQLDPDDAEIRDKREALGGTQVQEVQEVQVEPVAPSEPIEPSEPVEPLPLDSFFEALEAQVTRDQEPRPRDEEP